MSTYMTPTGEILPAAVAGDATSTTTIGFGITVSIDGKPVTLEMADITAIAKGNFNFAMPPGDKVGFDQLGAFYTSLQTETFTFLPPIDWASQPEPIKTMAGFGLWIENFQIVIESASVKRFGIDVKVDFHNWPVPGIPKLQVLGTSLSVLYDAAGKATLIGAQPLGAYGLPAGEGYAAAIPAS